MKAKLIRNRLMALIMSFVLFSGQVMPVLATGTEDETVTSADEADEETADVSDKEIIEMPAELFNISIACEDEGAAAAADDLEEPLSIYETEEAEEGEIITEDAGNSVSSNNGYALGGLSLGNTDAYASTVDEGITYKTIMENKVEGASYTSIASDIKPGGASATDAAFPYSSSEASKICSYMDENYPKSRDQNPYGTCWAHSTLAAAEFNMIAHKKADKTIDTSELALAYWTSYQGTAGPAGDNGSTVKRRYAKSAEENFLQSGGNSITAAMTLFQQRGITAESDVPYSTAASVLASEKIDPALERKDAFYVTDYQEYDIANNPSLVKEGIIENGGLSVAFCWLNEGYNSTYNSYYVDKKVGLNHFVTLVGWDDNFPKENFKGAYLGSKPSKNGAWLIRNSWNEDSSNAEMNYTDYFWMSYEDMSLVNAAGFSAVPASQYQYDNCYYYDTQVYVGKKYNSYGTAANVYKTSVCPAGEVLSAAVISVSDLKSGGTNYTIEVYRNIPDGGNPSSGTKVEEATTKGTLYLDGTYTIELNESVRLDPEENFAVVVTRDDNISCVIATDFNWDGWNLVSDMVALPGQSWVKTTSGWQDTQTAGNFVIHALTENAGAYVKVTPKNAKLAEGGEMALTAEAFDAAGKPVTSAAFTWASDNSSVVTVDGTGKITAVAIGTATVTATYNGLVGKCKVTVGSNGVTSRKVDYGSTTINGTVVPLNATVNFANTTGYKARKIKVKEDLFGEVPASSLYDYAKTLSTTGNVTKDVITWKYVAKKNKNANSGSYFYLKASVAKKGVTTAQGITGKNLKQLKKAVSAFNKAAKKKENRISFTITPINAFEMLNERTMVPIVNKKFGIIFHSFSHFRARLEPEKQPEYSSTLNYKKWTKISNKEFIKSKVSGTTYKFIPKNKNVTGQAFTITF